MRERYSPSDGGGAVHAGRLTAGDLEAWEDGLINADGTKGAHFTEHDLAEAVRVQGVHFDGFDMAELTMVANMLYSDYCEAMAGLVSKDKTKEAMAYVRLAKAWLEDADGLQGAHKLANYYKYIAKA